MYIFHKFHKCKCTCILPCLINEGGVKCKVHSYACISNSETYYCKHNLCSYLMFFTNTSTVKLLKCFQINPNPKGHTLNTLELNTQSEDVSYFSDKSSLWFFIKQKIFKDFLHIHYFLFCHYILKHFFLFIFIKFITLLFILLILWKCLQHPLNFNQT